MTIVRVQRKQKDFFVAKTEALNQKELSFKAKGLWAYAMSRPDDWQFMVEHLISVSTEKKTAIYSALNELIETGYCIREQKQDEKGRWAPSDYIIFETLEDSDNFKKCLPHSGFPHTDNPHPENQPLLSIDPKLSIEKEIIKSTSEQKKQKTGPSADASVLADEFYKIMKTAHGEDFREPNMDSWVKHFDKMLRLDKRDITTIRAIMNWVIKDSFWRTNILSPGNLREKFLSLKLKMEMPDSTFKKKSLKSEEAKWTRTNDIPAEIDILTPLLASLK
jgi:hypothetical protein